MKKIPVKLYLAILGATVIIFVGAWLVSLYINNQKTAALKDEENIIATQILALQAKSDILTATVKNAGSSNGANSSATTTAVVIASGLTDLQNKLSFMQNQLGPDNPDLFRLERYFSLLEIKDYTLERALNPTPIKKQSAATSTPLIFILYFYPNGTCNRCLAQEYVLQAIKQQYPQAHVYSFNYIDDLPAVASLITLPKIPATTTPPFVIVNNTLYPAFSDLSSMEAVIK